MTINKNFVIKNGLEVNTDLIFADTDSNKVGIATTTPSYTLEVNGNISGDSIDLQNINSTGISTFNDLVVDGYVSIGNTIGAPGQILTSTGVGITWSNLIKSSEVFTATVGQSVFNFSYKVGSVEVYINGVRLAPTEFQATDGLTVVLSDVCFGNETVEILGSTLTDTSPVKIEVVGSTIKFSVVGIGSTTLTLF